MVDAAVAGRAPRWSPTGRSAASPPTASGYRVHSGDGRSLDAERVVVAAGGWLPTLLDRLPLPDGFRSALPRFEVSQENAYHFPYRDPQTAVADVHPQGRRDPDLQPARRPRRRVPRPEAGRVQRGTEDDAPPRTRTARIDPANRDRIIAYVEQYVPGLVPEPYAETTCLFTNTPTEDFLIDGVDGITIVSACSGHGAKFAPVIGELAAAAATGDADAVPARFRAGAVRKPCPV